MAVAQARARACTLEGESEGANERRCNVGVTSGCREHDLMHDRARGGVGLG